MTKYVVFSDEDITFSLEYIEQENLHFIHSEVKKWSLSRYKKYLLIFAEILNQLAKNGVTALYAIPPTEKEEKWQQLFGFTDTGQRYKEYKIMGIYYGT